VTATTVVDRECIRALFSYISYSYVYIYVQSGFHVCIISTIRYSHTVSGKVGWTKVVGDEGVYPLIHKTEPVKPPVKRKDEAKNSRVLLLDIVVVSMVVAADDDDDNNGGWVSDGTKSR
jgi:hypothetical protein